MPHKRILIYNDKDVATSGLKEALQKTFYGAATGETNGKKIRQGSALNENVLALFLPGIIGDHSPYGAQIGEEGNKAIRDYVEQGGVFVGICAGAFYAASYILYNPPWLGTPKTSTPGLSFFPGLAKGPIPGLARHSDREGLNDCTITTLHFNTASGEHQTTGIAYGNGPMLFPYDEQNLEVIAKYEDVAGKPIAIAVQKVGKGLAFFVGVLPYIAPTDMKLTNENLYVVQLNESLKRHEEGRKLIWDDIVSRIKKHSIELGRASPLPDLTKSLS